MMLKQFTILFVENDIQIHEQMEILLQDEVKELYHAYNGEEGLTLYKEKKPDIILSDINMPIMSGLDMAVKIKKENKEQAFLFMSAFDERNILLDAINIGVDGFIVKPVDMTILYERLNCVAEHIYNRIETQKTKEKLLAIEKKQEMLSLYNLAHYDVLTDIPNRFLFNKTLDQTISRAKRLNGEVVLFLIDLDNFKNVNDTYGHKAGDHVLVTIVNNIKKVIRKEDIFSRLGGDEFALIIENNKDNNNMKILAEKINQVSTLTIGYQDKKINISCSIGISRYPQDTQCIEELIHYADLAMYASKHQGKSHFNFHHDNRPHIIK